MHKKLISLAAAAALAATASAQQIVVNLGGAWVSSPVCQQVYNPFNTSNGQGS